MRTRRSHPRTGAWLRPVHARATLVALLLAAGPLAAQDPPTEPAGDPPRRRPILLWTVGSDARRVIFGQWTWHFSENRSGIQNDRILAVVYDGYFVGSFRTTHGPRALTVGVERHWARVGDGALRAALGYRLGLVYGYDERLGWVAEAVPILPFAQPMVYVEAGPLGMDFTHTWVVVSLAVSIRF